MDQAIEYRDNGNMIQFKKSSFCEGGSSCVDFARVAGGVLLRHSNHPAGAMLYYTTAEWEAFMKGYRASEFS